MLNRLRHHFCPDLGIDLGTTNTIVGVAGRGILLDEPSVVAVRSQDQAVLGRGNAVGRLAKQMLGRTPEGIQAVRPLRGGVVIDFELCEAMLSYFFRKAGRQSLGLRPRVLVSVPLGVTKVERRAVFAAAERAGAGQVYLLPEVMAASVGVGLPISEPLASMVCHLGGGTTEMAVVCLGEVVVGKSLRHGGDDFDQAIRDHLRVQYSLKVGPQTAERLKLEVGCAEPLETELTAEVSGLDAASGTPRKAMLTSEDLREALGGPLRAIEDGLRSVIEQCPPELVADLADHGLVLTGGGADLRQLDSYLARRLGIPVRRHADPRRVAARGILICLENLRDWSRCLDAGD